MQGARPFIYKGLHLALENVAVKSLNIYDAKIWMVVHFYISLYQEKRAVELSIGSQNGSH